MKKVLLFSSLLSALLYAESLDEAFDGFDDAPLIPTQEENCTQTMKKGVSFFEGVSGSVSFQANDAYHGTSPDDHLNSLKTSLFLDYEHKFENGWKLKTNAKWYYDAIYDLRDKPYSEDERKENQHETELFDAYIEGSLSDNLDVKLGRQVVVWGRSDTIRITDVLNPIDNRKPAMVDIEDLRLPVAMVKVDYFVGDWRLTPMVILEQRFSKNPPFGSAFNPMPEPSVVEEHPSDPTYAFSLGAEFSGWDINFYVSRLYDDAGYYSVVDNLLTHIHKKVTMYGAASNILWGSWLFKGEVAYFDGLHYTTTQEKTFSRTDTLLGVEYNGIADTRINYDISLRHFNTYDNRLIEEDFIAGEDTYQHALRIGRDFMHATLSVNYLLSLYGKRCDEGGYQRVWLEYALVDGVNLSGGVVDYIGGSKLFDSIENNDMLFMELSYSF